jgi:hypothetical protein
MKSMLFAPELALARAWTRSARRDDHGAIAAARARTADAVSRRSRCARCSTRRDWAIRPMASRGSVAVDCVLGQLALQHARALVAKDAAALNDVSARFDAIGMKRSAAAAAARLRAPWCGARHRQEQRRHGRAGPSLLVAPAMADAGPDQEIRVTYGGRAAIGLICRA